MDLGREVSKVACSLSPYDFELALAHSVAHPVVPHVDCFGAFLFGLIVDKLGCDFVVDFANGGRLRVAKVFESVAYGDCQTAVGV